MSRLLLLGRPGCGLCAEMRERVEPVARRAGLELDERSIEEDADLLALYVLEIPVLLLDGVEIARHRVGEAELESRLRAAGIALR